MSHALHTAWCAVCTSRRPGDTVEILTGPLKGFKCELVTLATKKLATVRLGMLGSAVVEVTLDNVKKVEVEEE